ncbi:transcription initiation factor IID, 31kD subunit-domain-containing protein [Multifurca ochricompacta]|uniref:Transcription initiation factor IID, 31kD subunit-domain-containing protein n=1 Tax=Multifurca ochricompacta TaxID=376703 RepID=A0AAD4QQR8_9AGAM|nr:transcription initiation factor IID, 31kD subunit-domain-containing protein [Multifurca ochricompacta]
MSLPPAARAIALLLASTPTVQDAQPGVLHQLLEFSHRYTAQVLSDALVYSEHAGRPNKVEMDDVTLAVQARVGWEFGGRVPKEYILSLATQTNAQPLPPVPEVFGLRLPPANECLTAVDFDLVPNRPPPEEKQYDEDVEEIIESASEDEDEDMEPATIPLATTSQSQATVSPPVANPVNAVQTPSEDVDMVDTLVAVPNEVEEGSDEDDGLFAGGEESGADEPMEEVTTATEDQADGAKRKLVEEDDYD